MSTNDQNFLNSLRPARTTYGWQDKIPRSCGYVAPAVLNILGFTPSKSKIVDIGSGNGVLCSLIHKQGHHVVGLEADQEGVNLSRSNFPDIDFHTFKVGDDPADLIGEYGYFDYVISTEVIEHLYSPQLLARLAQKILKPGGKLVISTPYHGYAKNLLLSLFNKWDHHHNPLWEGGHIKFWSRFTLSQLLVTEGFILDEFKGVGRFPFLWKSMILIASKPSEAN